MNHRGRRILDDVKQRGHLAILSVGCSQNMAAKYVGCSPATIRREAARDPKFAQKLREAKGNAELGLVKNIRSAANKEQYWRAAAWRSNACFPKNTPGAAPTWSRPSNSRRFSSNSWSVVMRHVPVDEYRKNIVKDMESLARSFGQTIHVEEPTDDSD